MQISSNIMKKRGFTLIELLVVISIIALLIAILLPALGGARETARTIKCSSNQRQLTIAMFAYQGDSDSQFPSYFYFGGGGQPWDGSPLAGAAWANALQYMGYFNNGAELMSCPTFADGNKLDASDIAMDSLIQGHYGYNYVHIGGSLRVSGIASPAYGGNNTGSFVPAIAEVIAQPSDTYLMMDTVRDIDIPTDPRIQTGSYVVEHRKASQFHPRPRHGNGEAVLPISFADGHSSTVEVDDRALPYSYLTAYVPDGLPSTTNKNNKWDRR